jgi:hypothetical protein
VLTNDLTEKAIRQCLMALNGCIIFGVGEGILSETEIAHLK